MSGTPSSIAIDGSADDFLVGSIDQGTTSTRFLIFNKLGEPLAIHQQGLNNIYPQSGWHEHDPLELFTSVQNCMAKATEQLRAKGYNPSQIRAIGVTNQRETTVLWDKVTGEPLHNAIAWPDTRTSRLVRDLKARDGADKLLELCGLPLSTYPSSVKLLWLLKNVDAVKSAYEEGRLVFGTIDSWLVYKLNGGAAREGGPIHITDPSNASRTMFMNLKTLQYDDNLLAFFGIDRTKIALPEIVPSAHSKAFGFITEGPLKGTPIAGCLGDQSAALVGQLGFKPGQAKSTYGTGCFLLYNIGTEPIISKAGLLTTVAFDFGDGKPMYALEGSVAVAGSGVTFLHRNWDIIADPKAIDEVALTVPDNGGVYFVTAFSGLFAPYWIDDAKGTIFGITAHTQKGHIARATLEATCHQTAAILDSMAADSGRKLSSLAVDGGLSNSDLCMQMQADLSGITVDRPSMRETSALGAAIAAGLATGIWPSIDELQGINTKGRTAFMPLLGDSERAGRRGQWDRAVQMSRGWVAHEEDKDRVPMVKSEGYVAA